MKKLVMLLFAAFVVAGGLQAQKYKVTTDQQDSFSIALVKLMNAAVSQFKDYRAELLRSTSLMGYDYKLTISFPGCTMGIVRERDWDKNAYLEFRGFPDKASLAQGVRVLVNKIRMALGDQLYDPNKEREDISFYGMSIKDRNGYFSMNLEIFSSSSSAPVYLLGPEKEDESRPAANFILLKVYGGTPAYQYYVPAMVGAPDNDLHRVLQQLLDEAETDFDSLRYKKNETILNKPKRADTLRINGYEALINYRGANHSASLLFPASTDPVEFNKQWEFYQKVLQGAVGRGYVYRFFSLHDEPSVVYYRQDYETNKPTIYLEQDKKYDGRLFIKINIRSAWTHETKRGLDRGDF